MEEIWKLFFITEKGKHIFLLLTQNFGGSFHREILFNHAMSFDVPQFDHQSSIKFDSIQIHY